MRHPRRPRLQLLLIPLLALAVWGTHDPAQNSRAGERGDKQMSFGGSETSVYSGMPRKDLPEPLASPEGPQSGLAQPPLVSRDQAHGNKLRTDLGSEAAPPLQDSKTARKEGQSAGQISNVPGSTNTSPNGTSNFYGTGGIPVFPEDIIANGKTGGGGG